ncbi:MAG TPA: metalloregulator ArsR/SmtB family transcription factor [Caulobacteraceae bacterium]|nr:metalloregulator ArsR/SmtB family transcription factor [Caulobacteraceae bacterium]
MPEADIAALLAFFKAMANESRLRIVGLLAERERTGQELAELLDLKEPTVSHHLAMLRDLGLVTSRAEGVTHWHALKPEALADFNKALFDRKEVAAMTAPKQSWEDKVLATFVQADGTITNIPASRRKRRVLLVWLVEKFEDGRRYAEAEVNAEIQRHHWDCATLRRELIGYRMMARENGVYWRLPKSQWVSEGPGEA